GIPLCRNHGRLNTNGLWSLHVFRVRMAVRNFGGTSLFQQVRDDLVLYRWSPQQIAAKLKAMHPDDPSQRVSHETIYAAIYAHPRGGLK
ncbi:IS30 family transposase, partial [Xanthomonas oryzae pv. oryzicola]